MLLSFYSILCCQAFTIHIFFVINKPFHIWICLFCLYSSYLQSGMTFCPPHKGSADAWILWQMSDSWSKYCVKTDCQIVISQKERGIGIINLIININYLTQGSPTPWLQPTTGLWPVWKRATGEMGKHAWSSTCANGDHLHLHTKLHSRASTSILRSSTLHSHKWNFAHKCLLLLWVELRAWAQAPSTVTQSSICMSGGRKRTPLAQMELCISVCEPATHTYTSLPGWAAMLERLGTAGLTNLYGCKTHTIQLWIMYDLFCASI